MRAVPPSLSSDNKTQLQSFDPTGVAVVFGAQGGIGGALLSALSEANHFKAVVGFSRRGNPPVDMTNEGALERALATASVLGDIRLAINATGFLHDAEQKPEKSWRELDAQKLTKAFAINSIGPALLMKHLLPLLPRTGKAVFANLSARVGSIGDNRLGGWYAYRASKAALNQLVRTAAIELERRAPQAFCVALHPGTVATSLSAPFAKPEAKPHTPLEAARHLLNVLERLEPGDSGGFFDWRGETVPW